MEFKKIISKDIHLCDSCTFNIETCKATNPIFDITSKTRDNVIYCKTYNKKE